MSDKTEPEKKSYGLKPNESELIRGELNRHNAALASILSFIAVERLAYPVDQDTAFTLSQDMKEILIWQNTPEPVEKPVDLGDNQTETAKALKGDK